MESTNIDADKTAEGVIMARHDELNQEMEQGDPSLSRYVAAEIFKDLGEVVGTGRMPEDVSPYAIGRAVDRAVMNNGLSKSHNKSEILRGLFSLGEGQLQEVMELIDSLRDTDEEIANKRTAYYETLVKQGRDDDKTSKRESV